MSEEQERTCASCRFYLARPGTGGPPQGQCRRGPPLAVPIYHDRAGWGVWPRVEATDWCGMHAFRASVPTAVAEAS